MQLAEVAFNLNSDHSIWPVAIVDFADITTCTCVSYHVKHLTQLSLARFICFPLPHMSHSPDDPYQKRRVHAVHYTTTRQSLLLHTSTYQPLDVTLYIHLYSYFSLCLIRISWLAPQQDHCGDNPQSFESKSRSRCTTTHLLFGVLYRCSSTVDMELTCCPESFRLSPQ